MFLTAANREKLNIAHAALRGIIDDRKNDVLDSLRDGLSADYAMLFLADVKRLESCVRTLDRLATEKN